MFSHIFPRVPIFMFQLFMIGDQLADVSAHMQSQGEFAVTFQHYCVVSLLGSVDVKSNCHFVGEGVGEIMRNLQQIQALPCLKHASSMFCKGRNASNWIWLSLPYPLRKGLLTFTSGRTAKKIIQSACLTFSQRKWEQSSGWNVSIALRPGRVLERCRFQSRDVRL